MSNVSLAELSYVMFVQHIGNLLSHMERISTIGVLASTMINGQRRILIEITIVNVQLVLKKDPCVSYQQHGRNINSKLELCLVISSSQRNLNSIGR